MNRLGRAMLYIGSAIAFSGCVTTSGVPADVSQAIPSDARAVRIYSDQPPATFYRGIYQAIAAAGYSIAQENEQMGTLSTQPKDIGQETTLRIGVFVQDTTGGSMGTLRGQ